MPNLRPYGPGKFNTMLDSYVYQVSLEGGCDDEVGEWYGIMRNGGTIFTNGDPMWESLTEDEREYLTSRAGVIIREDSDGFVAVHYFETQADLDAKWDAILAEHEEENEEEEDN